MLEIVVMTVSMLGSLYYCTKSLDEYREIQLEKLLSSILTDVVNECKTTNEAIGHFHTSNKHNEWALCLRKLIEWMPPVNERVCVEKMRVTINCPNGIQYIAFLSQQCVAFPESPPEYTEQKQLLPKIGALYIYHRDYLACVSVHDTNNCHDIK